MDRETKFHCSKCGEPEHLQWLGEKMVARMEERKLCHSCNFWDTLSNRQHKTVIGGHLYVPGPNVTGRWLGMSGRRFDIRYLSDGRCITTNDLWSQGQVPQNWIDKFPDTAEFLGEAEKCELQGDITRCWNPSDRKNPEHQRPTRELYGFPGEHP